MPQPGQNRARSEIRRVQPGQTVLRSRSAAENDAVQYEQLSARGARAAPQAEQRTIRTAPRSSRGTSSTSPQRQRTRSPDWRSEASYWRRQVEQPTRMRSVAGSAAARRSLG
jgi:hypothetical protein